MRLGWNFLKAEGLIERESESFRVIRTREGEYWIVFARFPPLSKKEQEFLAEFLHGFRNSNPEAEALAVAFAEHCWKQGIELNKEQKKYLYALAKSSVNGLGPLNELLECEWLEEIAVTGVGKNNPVRCYDIELGWMACNFCFEDEETVKDWINLLGRSIGRRITLQNPKLSASLPDKSRVHATISPLSEAATVTIRKFREQPWSALELGERETISWNALAFLSLALQSDCSLLACGNTGSGKTTTLNALLQFFPASERIVCVEETPEMRIPHQHQVRLVSGEHAKMCELIWDTLRMRPDRIVVGEVRTPEEVRALMDTILAGQGKGSCATMHAQSVAELEGRMKSYGVGEQDLRAIDLVLVQKRWSRQGKKIDCRKVVEIVESTEEGFRTLYEFDFARNELRKKNPSGRVAEKIAHSFGISAQKVGSLIQETEEKMRRTSELGLNAEQFFALWNGVENARMEREMEAVLRKARN
ncbi:MAG: ATPase, T2SS/T4P/T4SS family [Candidatus Diapherotrites archaeon]